MTPEKSTPERRTLADFAYQFLVGSALGMILAAIAWLITAPTPLKLWNIAAIAATIVVCGLLSVLIGKRFLTAVSNFIESFPPIA
ncbi:MAG: hypothetical protein AAGI69_15995 [Cyanobacteria bacterium P01_H01_bin.21]